MTEPTNDGSARRESVRLQLLAAADNYQTATIGPGDAREIAAMLVVDGSTSDGFHTFDELYRHRMLLNAALFTQWAAIAEETVSNYLPVHKSLLHHDGERPFGGGWFIVMCHLPTGQISYHYPLEHWDLFDVPEVPKAAPWDGHTAEQAADRLQEWLEG